MPLAISVGEIQEGKTWLARGAVNSRVRGFYSQTQAKREGKKQGKKGTDTKKVAWSTDRASIKLRDETETPFRGYTTVERGERNKKESVKRTEE